MDLLASIRKEGSRGGRDNFKWSDVAADTHRENYLGHSLMAPVGRWQKNRDLGWYANSSTDAAGTPGNNPQEMARLAEIAKIKEAENEALAEALGFPVVSANQTKLGGGAGAPTGASEGEVRRAVQEAGIGDHDGYDPDRDERSAGVGYGTFEGGAGAGVTREKTGAVERLGGTGPDQRGGGLGKGRREETRHKRRRRSRSPGAGSGEDERARGRRHRHRHHDHHDLHHRRREHRDDRVGHRERERHRERGVRDGPDFQKLRSRRRSRSRSRSRNASRDRYERRRERDDYDRRR